MNFRVKLKFGWSRLKIFQFWNSGDTTPNPCRTAWRITMLETEKGTLFFRPLVDPGVLHGIERRQQNAATR